MMIEQLIELIIMKISKPNLPLTPSLTRRGKIIFNNTEIKSLKPSPSTTVPPLKRAA
jgi:hypothetical protein